MSKVYRYVAKATRSQAVARSVDAVARIPISCLAAALKLAHDGRANAIDEKALEARIQQLRPYRPSSLKPLTDADENAPLALSVIVPVFNAEAYVSNCIDSVLEQDTAFQYELIVVDDGSTDGSPRILQQYGDHPRVSIVRIPNGGVALARNEGLRRARGRYVMFVDSDDYVPRDCVETLLAPAMKSGADIVQGSYWIVDTAGALQRTQQFGDVAAARADPDVSALSGYPWGKVIKRELFGRVQFPEGMAYEDTIVALILLPSAKGYISLSQPVYYYRENPRGLSARLTKDHKTLDAYWVVSKLLSDRRTLGLPFDSRVFRQVKTQFGPLLYMRLANYADEVKRAVFYLCCRQMDALRSEIGAHPASRADDALDHAFRTRNYALWKLLCFFEL
ncbi:Glycosyltransferase, group 2 family protein [Burkholderia sp. 8Y]|uniref:glycosyltransferase family 2 protein n=1 Tax=Burkholderia sp. 8Y TaxID=2653133 RepID=UPI0012F04CCA|nr:glycosyltransferase family 2 protein [Burkholderia sp. 8Y]VXA95509.1 Glycosyltransferase, group 2 family protein [Burkholderia sp. 8Y]